MATNREIVLESLDLINRGHVREGFKHHSENYIQHNPTCDDGLEDAIALIEKIVRTPGFSASIKRVIAEGDFVFVHQHISFGGHAPDLAVADIIRLENGKIVEHWDVIQEVPSQTVSGNAMV